MHPWACSRASYQINFLSNQLIEVTYASYDCLQLSCAYWSLSSARIPNLEISAYQKRHDVITLVAVAGCAASGGILRGTCWHCWCVGDAWGTRWLSVRILLAAGGRSAGDVFDASYVTRRLMQLLRFFSAEAG
jgi:hypothetical protein